MHDLATRITPLTGRWAQDDVLPYVSGMQLLLSALVALLTGIVIVCAHFWARRAVTKPGRAAGAGGTTPTAARILWIALEQARAPFLVFLTTWGAYCALSILAFRIEPYGETVLSVLAWIKTTALILAFFWFLFRVIHVLERELTPESFRTRRKWDFILVSVGMRTIRLVLPLVAVLVIAPTLDIPPGAHGAISVGVSLLLIGFVGIIFCELANTAEKAIHTEYRFDVADNLSNRKIHTQVGILKKIFVTLVVLICLACMLTVFEPVRALGKSILASAGVAGIVLGIAAQKSLGTLLAGIQIAFSQPIRLDDVVIVEGEWGRIEEITLTYVVVAIWDLRRMVLPITYFIEKPFQNWTRSNAALLGTVFLYLDYTAPIAELRAELDRILEKSTLWDKKVKGLQVTDAKDNVIEVRILVSATNSGAAFDLRCEVREKLIAFIQQAAPGALPRSRGALEIARLDRTEEEARTTEPVPEAGSAPHVLTAPQGMASPVTVNQKDRPAPESGSQGVGRP
ncbi:MAG TPA: mechanosensitive ion channel family protein [Opitutaceae bacterium]